MPVALTLDSQTRRFESETIRIGTALENEISLPKDSRLAPVHAVVRSVNGRWIVESSGGEGVRIGNRRPVSFAWLNPGDAIRLTETGPELIFEPDPPSPPANIVPAGKLVPIPIASSVPSMPRELPATAANPSVGRGASVRDQHSRGIVSGRVPANAIGVRAIIIGGVLLASLLVVAAFELWPRASKTDAPPLQTTHEPDSSTVDAETTHKRTLDPQDYLVLVGIGDQAGDNRPNLLGVGWLWDDHTAVIPRTIGEALSGLLAVAAREGAPRQAWIIQGVALRVDQIVSTVGCPDVSLLRLKEPAELVVPAREQWHGVNAADIERRRARAKAKPLSHVSYSAFPRSPGGSGSHGLSLHAYDPELVNTSTEEARFIYEQRRHILKSTDPTARLERGGILIDEDGRIVGMTLIDSSVVWTEALQRAFAGQ